MRRRTAVALVAGLLVAACGGDDGGEAASSTTTTTSSGPSATTVAPAAPGLEDLELRLEEVARLDQPLAMTWCAGDPEPFVAGKGGHVRRLDGSDVLDLSDAVSTGNEQGLLGLACAPDGTLLASYTNRDGDTRIDAFTVEDGRADREGGRRVFELAQPAANHNGGNIVFGPDGALWLGLGDGGGGNDTFDTAQDESDLLGSMVRFPDGDGDPEIVVIGVRNPWRFSFDRDSGDLWIGDVGQGAREEINRLAAGSIDGANLGWPTFEGTRPNRDDVEAPGAVPPVFEYGRDEGQSVVGGYVYRGGGIPALRGAYVFTDTYASVLRAITLGGGEVREHRFGEVPGGLAVSFAEDPDGELYVLSLDGGVFRVVAA